MLRDKRGNIVLVWIITVAVLITFDILYVLGMMSVSMFIDALVSQWTDAPIQAWLTINGFKAGAAITAVIVNGGVLYWAMSMSSQREDVTYPMV